MDGLPLQPTLEYYRVGGEMMSWKQYFSGKLQKFFDKAQGNKVALREFPFLFALLNAAGFSGILVSAAWFVTLAGRYPMYWTKSTFGVALGLELGFLLIIILSTIFGQSVVDSVFDRRRTKKGWDFFARTRMAVLLILFAATCSTLIWATGGMFSPFTPFYIMVFTLALTRCRIPHPGTALLVLFVAPFACAGAAAEFGAGIVTNSVAQDIKQGNPKDYADFAFALISMIVPYASTYYADARARRQKQAAAEKKRKFPAQVQSAKSRTPKAGSRR